MRIYEAELTSSLGVDEVAIRGVMRRFEAWPQPITVAGALAAIGERSGVPEMCCPSSLVHRMGSARIGFSPDLNEFRKADLASSARNGRRGWRSGPNASFR
jgi:hypothetical protein